MDDPTDKFKMYLLSGGPQDLSHLYLPSLKEVADFVEADIAEMQADELEELEYTIEIKLMTQKEIDDLPEYDF